MNRSLKARFYKTCVDWNGGDVDALISMIDSGREITYETFKKQVCSDDLEQVSRQLGYGWGREKHNPMRLHTDFHVRFFTGILDGVRVPYFVHSAIEHVFLPNTHPRRTTIR